MKKTMLALMLVVGTGSLFAAPAKSTKAAAPVKAEHLPILADIKAGVVFTPAQLAALSSDEVKTLRGLHKGKADSKTITFTGSHLASMSKADVTKITELHDKAKAKVQAGRAKKGTTSTKAARVRPAKVTPAKTAVTPKATKAK